MGNESGDFFYHPLQIVSFPSVEELFQRPRSALLEHKIKQIIHPADAADVVNRSPFITQGVAHLPPPFGTAFWHIFFEETDEFFPRHLMGEILCIVRPPLNGAFGNDKPAHFLALSVNVYAHCFIGTSTRKLDGRKVCGNLVFLGHIVCLDYIIQISVYKFALGRV